MADRTVKYVLGANVSGFVSGMKSAQGATKNLNDTLMKNEHAARELTTGLGVIGAAAVAGAGLAIKTYASFDKQMSAVKATGGATASELGKLRDAAIDAGAQTAFSATEAAAGVENLLKAGVSAQDVLGGGLSGTLDLAASGALSVADAAEIAAGAMTQFKLGGEDVSHVADVLSAGAGKAQGDVSDLAGALKYAGVPLSQLGVSLEETTGTLALFASNAIVGEQAGTSLRSMVSSLTSPSKVAADEMSRLGISVFDGQGKFIGLAGVAGQLKSQMSGLTDAERAASLGRIFGNESLQAANVLYDGGAGAVKKWTAAVDDQGYAAETAAARLDNLSGDLEGLGGALESLFIKSGSGGNDMLRGMAQGATDLVNALGEIPGPVLSATALIVGGGGLVALGVAGMGKLVIGVNSAKTAMAALGISSKAAGLAAGAVGAAVAVAAVGFTVWAQNAAEAKARTEDYKSTLDELGNATDATSKKMVEALAEKGGGSNWIDSILGRDGESAIDIAKKMGLSAEDLTAAIEGQAGAVEHAKKAADDYVAASGFMESDDRINDVARLNKVMTEQSDAFARSGKESSQAAEASEELGIAQGDLAGETSAGTIAAQEQAAAQQDAAQQDEARKEAIDALVESMNAQRELQETITNELLGARDAQRGFEQAIDAANDAAKANGQTLDLNTEKGRANQEALDGIASSGQAYVESLREQGASQEKIDKALGRTRENFIDVAESMGLSKGEAKALATELGLIPDASITVDADTSLAQQKGESAKEYIQRLRAEMAVSADPSLAREAGEATGAYIDRLTATIEVDGGTAPAREKGESAQAYISRLKSTIGVDANPGLARQKGESTEAYISRLQATMGVGADTSGAAASGAALQRRLTALRATVGVSADTTAAAMAVNAFVNQSRTIHVGVSSVQAKAAGGPIYGGTPGKDSVPIMAMPGEHMLTTSDVSAMGGQAGVYAFRQALHSGLAGFASGGAVGSATRSLASQRGNLQAENADLRSLKAYLKDDERALAEAKKNKASAATIKRLKAEVARDRKLIAAQEKAVAAQEKRVAEEKARVGRLRETKADVSLDINRGNIREQATSGLSGAYSVSDQMRSLLRSGDLTGSQGKSLSKAIGSAEPAMKRLYGQADKLAASLEKARDRASDLRDISDRVASGLSGEQSLGDSIAAGVEGSYKTVTRSNARGDTWNEEMWDPGTKASVTSKGLVSDAKSKAAGIKAFAGKLSQLQKLGLSGAILQEVASLGTEEGTLVADALIKGGKSDVSSLNAAYKDIATYSGKAGQYVTEGFYKGGVAAADGLVKGLESQEKSVNAAVLKIAKGMEGALKKALGIKSPSKVFRGLMHHVGDGAVLGLQDSEPSVSRAAARLMSLPSTVPISPFVASSNVNGQAAGGSFTVRVDNITTVSPDAAAKALETRMRDSIVMHGLRSGVLV